MSQIVSAVYDYQSAYSVFPTSTASQGAAIVDAGDFTYGGTFNTPSSITTDIKSYGQTVPNYEIMGVLLNLEQFGNNTPTINVGHIKNPRGRGAISVKFSGDTKSAGVGLDGVYRDPWGNPYVITLDFNGDGKARDSFYSDSRVSADPNNASIGLQGLIRRALPNGASAFECVDPVTVWSAGPDKMIDPNAKANTSANKDNILTWQ